MEYFNSKEPNSYDEYHASEVPEQKMNPVKPGASAHQQEAHYKNSNNIYDKERQKAEEQNLYSVFQIYFWN